MKKLVLKPDFSFKPSDFVTVEADDPAQMPIRSESKPLQAAFDLSSTPFVGESEKTAQKPAKAPWDDANDLIHPTYAFRMTQRLHKKMGWITQNVPGYPSLQKLISKSVEEQVEKLLKEHYKP